MTLLEDILEHNEKFVENKDYEEFQTTKFPKKRIVILTCMDTRLIELLPKAMNLKNGDAKIIKSAGAIIAHPFGGIMRSILVALYELGADELYIIGHYDCGMSSVDVNHMKGSMNERGIDTETFKMLEYSGVDLCDWLRGFDDVTESVIESVDAARNHPLMANDIPIHGLVADPDTGRLDVIVDGYKYLEEQNNK